MTYTNHGRTSTKGNSGQKPQLGERNRHTLKGTVSVNHKSTTAKVTAELHIHLEHHFHKKNGVIITKPGHLMIENT